MPIQLGGVEFSINAKLGKTIVEVRGLTQALKDLDTQAVKTEKSLASSKGSSGGKSKAATSMQAEAAAMSKIANAARESEAAINASATAAGAFITAIGSSQLIGFIKNSTILAARVENLDTVMRNVGATANYTDGELSATESRIRALGITTQSARKIMTLFAQNNLDLAKAAQVARVAQDAAVIAGTNSSEAAEKIALGIQRREVRLLRTQGIYVNLRQEYEKFAKASGRTADSLSEQEKQQVALEAVLRRGVSIQGNYAKSLQDVYKQYTSLDRQIEEASRSLGEQFVPALGLAIKATSEGLQWFEKSPGAVKLFAASLTGSIGVLGVYTTALLLASTVQRSFSALRLAASAEGAGGAAAFLGRLGGGPAIAVVATIAAVTAALSALIAQSQKARQEKLGHIAESASTTIDLHRLTGEIDTFGKATTLSAEEQATLNAKMREAIQILPEHRDELEALTSSANDFANALRKIRPELAMPVEKIVQAAEAEVKRLENLVDYYKETIASARADSARQRAPGQIPEPGTLTKLKFEEQQNLLSLEEAQTRLKAFQDKLDAQKLRALDKQGEAAESALQLATQVSEKLQDEELKHLKDHNAQIIAEYEKHRRELSSQVDSIADIEKRHELRLKQIGRNQQQPGQSPVEFSAEQQSKRDEAASDMKAEFERRDKTLKAFSQTQELAARGIDETTQSTKRLNEELDLLGKGVSEEVIRALHALRENTDRAAEAQTAFQKKLAELEQQRSKLAATSVDQLKSPADRDIAEKKLQAVMEDIRTVEAARKSSREKQSVEERKLQRDLVTSQEKATADKVKNLQEFASKVVKERNDAISSTDDFINSKLGDLQEKFLPGVKELAGEVKGFGDAVKGAGSSDQISDVLNLFGPSVDNLLQHFQEQGAPDEVLMELSERAQQAFEALQQQAETRAHELFMQDRAVDLATRQLQVQYAILQKLQGEDGRKRDDERKGPGRITDLRGQPPGTTTQNGNGRITTTGGAPGPQRPTNGIWGPTVQPNYDSRQQQPPLLLPSREPMTPFSGGVGAGLEKSSAAAGQATSAMERMGSEVSQLSQTFVTAFRAQAEIADRTSAEVADVREQVGQLHSANQQRDQSGIKALRGRNLI